MAARFIDMYNSMTNTVISSSVDPFLMGRCSAICLRKAYIMMHDVLGTDVSFEIGAHEAVYSLNIKERYGDKIAVIAVEGSPRTHSFFSKRINFSDKNIKYLNAVVSDSNGEVSFYEYEEGEKSLEFSSIHARKEEAGGQKKKIKVTVESIKGDTLLESRFPEGKSVALWIDVEGAQKEVLDSFEESFRLGKISSVYIEVEREKLWDEQKMIDVDIINRMLSLGFSPFLRDNEYGNQYNILFVNKKFAAENFSVFHEYCEACLKKEMACMKTKN